MEKKLIIHINVSKFTKKTFFFSSRRRHTRYWRDWSSDVCSSDLTVDAMLRGDQISAELRWRDEEGVHRSQGRPRPSPREQLGAERFAGLVGAGSPWRMEPGWRGEGAYRNGGYREADRGSG